MGREAPCSVYTENGEQPTFQLCIAAKKTHKNGNINASVMLHSARMQHEREWFYPLREGVHINGIQAEEQEEEEQ